MKPEIDRLRCMPLFSHLGSEELETVSSWLEIRRESEGRLRERLRNHIRVTQRV